MATTDAPPGIASGTETVARSHAAKQSSVLQEIADTLRPHAGTADGALPPLMVLLTIVTGIVDAVAYLRLGHVFVANMTGKTRRRAAGRIQ